MADLADYIDDVIEGAPGCPRATAQRHLLLSAQRFCRETHYWQEALVDEPLSAGLLGYPLVGSGTVIAVKSVRHDERDVPGRSRDWLDRFWPGWDKQSSTSPVYHTLTGESPLILRLAPNVATGAQGRLYVRAALMPDDTGIIGDYVMDHHRDAIVSGAIERLVVMPKKSWTNPDMAGYHRANWTAGVSRAKTAVLKGFTDAPLTAYPRAFE